MKSNTSLWSMNASPTIIDYTDNFFILIFNACICWRGLGITKLNIHNCWDVKLLKEKLHVESALEELENVCTTEMSCNRHLPFDMLWGWTDYILGAHATQVVAFLAPRWRKYDQFPLQNNEKPQNYSFVVFCSFKNWNFQQSKLFFYHKYLQFAHRTKKIKWLITWTKRNSSDQDFQQSLKSSFWSLQWFGGDAHLALHSRLSEIVSKSLSNKDTHFLVLPFGELSAHLSCFRGEIIAQEMYGN